MSKKLEPLRNGRRGPVARGTCLVAMLPTLSSFFATFPLQTYIVVALFFRRIGPRGSYKRKMTNVCSHVEGGTTPSHSLIVRAKRVVIWGQNLTLTQFRFSFGSFSEYAFLGRERRRRRQNTMKDAFHVRDKKVYRVCVALTQTDKSRHCLHTVSSTLPATSRVGLAA